MAAANAVVTRFTADGDSAFTTRFDTFRNYGSLMRQGKKIYSVTSSAISAKVGHCYYRLRQPCANL